MVLQQVLLNESYRISLENIEESIHFRVYARKSKKITRIFVQNSFTEILQDYDRIKTADSRALCEFYNYYHRHGYLANSSLTFKRGFPSDLTDEDHLKIIKSIHRYRRKLRKQRGVNDGQ